MGGTHRSPLFSQVRDGSLEDWYCRARDRDRAIESHPVRGGTFRNRKSSLLVSSSSSDEVKRRRHALVQVPRCLAGVFACLCVGDERVELVGLFDKASRANEVAPRELAPDSSVSVSGEVSERQGE